MASIEYFQFWEKIKLQNICLIKYIETLDDILILPALSVVPFLATPLALSKSTKLPESRKMTIRLSAI